MYFDFDQGFLDVYSDVLLKLILMIFLIGKVTFPRKWNLKKEWIVQILVEFSQWRN